MRKVGIGEVMSLIANGADQGIVAFAPLFAEAMPMMVRVAYIQRVASIVAERAAVLARVCGDATADALANKRDVAPVHIAQLQAMCEELHRIVDCLPPSGAEVTTDDLAGAFRPRGPAGMTGSAGSTSGTSGGAARVMATRKGGL